MDEWLRIGVHQVNELLKHDPEYQEIRRRFVIAEEKYLQIMDKLTLEERECVGDYIALCEDLEYQRTHTAYRCGKLRRNVVK